MRATDMVALLYRIEKLEATLANPLNGHANLTGATAGAGIRRNGGTPG